MKKRFSINFGLTILIHSVKENDPVYDNSYIKRHLKSKLVCHSLSLFICWVTIIHGDKLIDHWNQPIDDEKEDVGVKSDVIDINADHHDKKKDVVRNRAKEKAVGSEAIDAMGGYVFNNLISKRLEHCFL